MALPENSTFCCLALGGPRLEVDGRYVVIPGLTVSNQQSDLILQPHWVGWLGSLQAEAFEKSTLYITAHLEREPAGFGTSHDFLDRRVRMLHQALLLLGCGYNHSALMVGGETYSEGGLHVGPIRSGLTPCRRPTYRRSGKVRAEDISTAAKILMNLEVIYSHTDDRLYRRLRKGFNVWVHGVEQSLDWNERFHAFVRSTEALLKTTIAKARSKAAMKKSKYLKHPWRAITPTFVQRGQAFIGRSDRNARLLRQFYEIRSSVEHIKDIMPKVKTQRGIDSREAFQFRALQSEILASAVYARILSQDDLLKSFSSETHVEGFWSRSGHGRQALWGSPIDLERHTRAQFNSLVAPEFIY